MTSLDAKVHSKYAMQEKAKKRSRDPQNATRKGVGHPRISSFFRRGMKVLWSIGKFILGFFVWFPNKCFEWVSRGCEL